MKLSKVVLTISALIASASLFAGTVTTSSNVSFLAFDGQKVKKTTQLQISDTNPHQVVVAVSSIIGSGSNDNYFESQPIVLTFDGNQEDVQIIAPNLRSVSDIDKFTKSPSFEIKTKSGQMISYKIDYLKGEGFMPNANIEANLAKYNESNGTAAVAGLVTTQLPMAAVGNSKVAKGKVMVQGENIAEQQLQYWFQQADKETQKRFLEWAKKK